jgi:hypothetical protein
MIEFELAKRGKARVWIDELPPVESLSSVLSWRQEGFGGAKGQAFHKRVVVEFFQPFGATFHYGLLGAEFQASASDELVVAVSIDTPSPKIPYIDSLAIKVDEVVVGSTPEYAEAVLTSLLHQPAELLPSGQLKFTFMAHGAVGSARVVFEKLASAVIRLLVRIEPLQGGDEMAEILKET